MPNHHHHHHVTGNHPPPPKPSPKLLSIFLKFVVMSLILSLFLLFIGLAAIILLHLLLAGSFLHRRRRRLLSRSHSSRTSSLSLSDIHNHLPPFVYSAAGQSTSADAAGESTSSDVADDDDCSICLECFNGGEICRVLPVCDHVFHARCVDRWLTKTPNCPICRTRIRFDAGGASDSVDCDDETKFLWAIGVGR